MSTHCNGGLDEKTTRQTRPILPSSTSRISTVPKILLSFLQPFCKSATEGGKRNVWLSAMAFWSKATQTGAARMPEVNKAHTDAAVEVKSHLTWCREERILDSTMYCNWNVSPSCYSWLEAFVWVLYKEKKWIHWIEYFLAYRVRSLTWANIWWRTVLHDIYCFHSFITGSCFILVRVITV